MLKKETFEEKREKNGKALEEQLLLREICGFDMHYGIKTFYEKGKFSRDSFSDLVKNGYGYSDDETDGEYKLAQVLTAYFIGSNSRYDNQFNLDCIIARIVDTFPDYKITFNHRYYKPTYKPIAMKTVIDNIKNVPTKYSDPIAELLKPIKSENELIGLVTKIYNNFENIKPKLLKIENETDQAIYKSVGNTAKHIANVVVRHKSKSRLSVKDIVHNFALNASLCFKIGEMDKDNE